MKNELIFILALIINLLLKTDAYISITITILRLILYKYIIE